MSAARKIELAISKELIEKLAAERELSTRLAAALQTWLGEYEAACPDWWPNGPDLARDALAAYQKRGKPMSDEDGLREAIAADIRVTLGRLIDKSTLDGGYDCCGCFTYLAIVEHAARIALGTATETEE